MLTLLAPDDLSWAVYFRNLPLEQQDVFYSPEYSELCARYIHRVGRPLCAVFETPSFYLMYPFLQRKIRSLVEDEGASAADYQDITGVYGRGGLVCNVNEKIDTGQFHTAFRAYCHNNRIICGFDRYHPILQNHHLVDKATKILDVGDFVVVDLDRSMSEIESNFKHAVRKNIKKAIRAGCEVFSETTLDHLNDFLRVYSSTLDRNHATRFYYIPSAFYQELPLRLSDKYRFFYTAIGDNIVSCELVLFHGLYCHSFVGGSLGEYRDACPNHLLKREILRFAQSAGCRYYLLGGGSKPYDGIWNYKRGFAPDGSLPSLVGGTVYDEGAYMLLREKMLGAGKTVSKDRVQFYEGVC